MPRPNVHGDSLGVYTTPMTGSRKTPLLPPVLPDMFVAGDPLPNAPAGTRELSVVRGISRPMPNSIPAPSAVIVAGFQYRPPAESRGAAVDAPPIDRLIGPTPLTPIPNCA